MSSSGPKVFDNDSPPAIELNSPSSPLHEFFLCLGTLERPSSIYISKRTSEKKQKTTRKIRIAWYAYTWGNERLSDNEMRDILVYEISS